MKAIRIHEFGDVSVLKYENLPKPYPTVSEIRIRVMAAGVNPLDWKIRKGFIRLPLPMTMGVDVSGVVDAIGPDVNNFKIGDKVFAKVMLNQGGYAEYTTSDASHSALMPRTTSFIEAAAIPTSGLTAWQALFDIAGLDKGQMVLIHGAAGGVGSFAVQFAKWKGAYVIGTASDYNREFLQNLGVDEVINYRTQQFENVVHDLDMVLDTIGEDTFERSWSVLKPNGFLVTTVANIPEGSAEAHGVRAKRIVSQPDGKELEQIAKIIDERHLKPIVTEVLPLVEARKAQEMSESRHVRGKIVLQIGNL
jgi:NADPH:quinone reductase-like Zn-dependent oxidoreductase